VTKSFAGGDVYEAPAALGAGVVNVLHRVGHVPVPEVTAGDISPDGTRVVLRNYTAAYEWDVLGGDVATALRGEPTPIPLPPQPQGEGITYTRDSGALLISSEGAGQPVYRLDRIVPEASPAVSVPLRAPGRRPWGWWPPVTVAALLLLVAFVLVRRRR
jgi:hypothetical protein